MIKEQAIEYCAEMWEIIADQRVHKAEAYRIMRSRHPELPNYISMDCFACHYSALNDKQYCNDGKCIVAPVWGGGTCCEGESPYLTYVHRGCDSDAARQIAEGCRALIKESEE